MLVPAATPKKKKKKSCCSLTIKLVHIQSVISS